MTRRLTLWLALLAGVCLTAGWAEAQIGVASGYNPWTGQVYRNTAGYNPWTGQVGYSTGFVNRAPGGVAGVGVGVNPWTGVNYRTDVARNPWTGLTTTVQQQYNPWTGRYEYQWATRP
jgi:hypothetical protein